MAGLKSRIDTLQFEETLHSNAPTISKTRDNANSLTMKELPQATYFFPRKHASLHLKGFKRLNLR